MSELLKVSFYFYSIYSHHVQCRVQCFPEGGANPKGGGVNLLFRQILPHKMHEIKGNPPLRSATHVGQAKHIFG